MARPVAFPRWADVGGDIVTPPSGKQDVGWVDNEQPANEFDNWFKNLVYQWVTYLDDGIDVEEEVPFTVFEGALGGFTGVTAGNESYLVGGGGTATLAIKLPVKIGRRLKSVSVHVVDDSAGQEIDVAVFKQLLTASAAPGAPVQLGATQSTTAVDDGNIRKLTVSGLTEVIVTDTTYIVQVDMSGAGTDRRLYRVSMITDRA